MRKILFLLFACLGISGMLFAANGDFVVVIDAGHGGKDPGAVRGKIKEKDINLAVAQELGKLIEKNMPGVKIVYTRDSDEFVPLEDRSALANKNKANLFISIHTNSTSAKTTSAAGADTYILGLARSAENLAVAKRENSVIKYEDDYTSKYEGFDPDSPESYIIFEFMTNQYMQQSLDLASFVQNDFKTTAKRVDRGVRQAGFLVLRESGMPSILIELGFINNPREASYLISPTGQRAMASAIYSGFKKYKDSFDKKGGTIVIPSPEKSSTRGEQQTVNISKENKAVSRANTTEGASDRTIAPKVVAQSAATSPPQSGIAPDEIEYRVQFLYSPVELDLNSSKFKGLDGVSYYIDNGYKYTIGSTTDYNEIRRIFNQVKKTFSDSFIIRMKNGKRL